MALRPWSHIPIADNGEPLLPLPAELQRLEPHPYVAVGAPYGEQGSPFRLRQGVIERLLSAQSHLQQRHPHWRLAVFDAWRPLEVQRFMRITLVGHMATEHSGGFCQPACQLPVYACLCACPPSRLI